MSATNQVKVLKVSGATVTLRLSVQQPDEQPLCVSPAFFAAQLQESTQWNDSDAGAKALGEELYELGLHVWGDEVDDKAMTRLNRVAKKFVKKIVVVKVVAGKVLAKHKHVWRVTDEDDALPSIEVVVELSDAKLGAHLRKGHEWGSSPPNFGSL